MTEQIGKEATVSSIQAEIESADVLWDVVKERRRQDEKWGVQTLGFFEWLAILGEEFGEAQKAAIELRWGAGLAIDYRTELIHTAAVAVAAVECYDRTASGGVYLAGPMKGCEQSEVHGWRDSAASLLEIPVIDPSATRDFSKRAAKDSMKEVVRPDKNDIDLCQILLAYCPYPSVGTSMEILYAWERSKTVVVILPDKMDHGPSAWTIAHAHHICFSVPEACAYISTGFGPREEP